MISKDYIVEKMKSLPDKKLEDIADFMKYSESKETDTESAESGAGNYLGQLSAYEKMLDAREIRWK